MTNTELQTWLDRDDFELLDAIKSEIRTHIAKLHAHSTQFYGYALLPGELEAICDLVAAFNCESDIAPEHIASSYYRYSVDEWANYAHSEFPRSSAIIDSRNAQFKKLHRKDNSNEYLLDDWEVAHANKLLTTILTAMIELRHDGLLGGEKSFAIIWISDSDHSIMSQSAKAPNSDAIYKTYIQEFCD
ncbi:DUF4303 domain-containing protein [Leptolyngbya sp. DQ-M1]|uniref:DUF4303 domain-containing protein n=1 Tax=Leptolyngbya sp. DQ-M1 TaxID=2933920 RepID=UPI003298409E